MRRNPDGIRSSKKHPSRVEKDHEYETVKYRTEHGPCQHNLHTPGGRLGETVIDGTDTKPWVPLPIDALERRGTVGAYRFYHRVRIECDLNGDHPMRLPLVQSQADTDTGFLRAGFRTSGPRTGVPDPGILATQGDVGQPPQLFIRLFNSPLRLPSLICSAF